MNYAEIVHLVNTDPVIQTLLEEPIPMRIAYLGLDGQPRSVPVNHLWNGEAFVFATPNLAYKVEAIAANPRVGFTIDVGAGAPGRETRAKVWASIGHPLPAHDFSPIAVHGRGTATVEKTPGVPQEHIDASRRMIGDDAKWAEWARVRRAETSGMARISIVPTHLVVIDFVTRFPPPVAVNVTAFGVDRAI
ncbi:pyridoxamine 5'-phosphate oxidase family protein [Nocardia terpenica]|uniref:Pyridoxamine 5'-phosphate oxidase n=1 Tax=Nocardia terpenica TaxID=455432 RepID=A0A291RIJ8_9NOCA|nr:pyridoxamine 5'-phosphate oxidase family protein [Nocardia terpenica]ATL67431.1 pyridoxamine 5'-phosphate oxidase [Nocardia terpenica]